MDLQISPVMFIGALLTGSLSAFWAYRRGKKPYLWFFIGFLFGIFGFFAVFFAGAGKKKEEAKPEPVWKIDGPSDKFWYYLDAMNEQQGPFSLDGLINAWKQGKLNLSSYVWHEDLPDWKQLKETLKLEV